MSYNQITKAVSKASDDSSKDLLKCLFLHRELITDKNTYPSRWTVNRKWNKLLAHPTLQTYLQSNQGMIMIDTKSLIAI